MVDIWIAVALALLTLLTAYLGVHVTLHPARTPRQKNAYKTGFVLCALSICVLIVAQGLRAKKSQEALTASLRTIAINTGTPPQVINNLPAPQVVITQSPAPPPQKERPDTYVQIAAIYPVGLTQRLEAGKSVSVNVEFLKVGSGAVEFRHAFLLTAEPVSTEVELEKSFRKDIKKQDAVRPKIRGAIEAIGTMKFWDTASSPSLSEEDIAALIRGDKRLYLQVHLDWVNADKSENHADRCNWFEINSSPSISTATVLHTCEAY